MTEKKHTKKAFYQEYKNMFRAFCKMASYYEKLTTDGFELNDEDKKEINEVIEKKRKAFPAVRLLYGRYGAKKGNSLERPRQ